MSTQNPKSSGSDGLGVGTVPVTIESVLNARLQSTAGVSSVPTSDGSGQQASAVDRLCRALLEGCKVRTKRQSFAFRSVDDKLYVVLVIVVRFTDGVKREWT
jgi:hypothetical protein